MIMRGEQVREGREGRVNREAKRIENDALGDDKGYKKVISRNSTMYKCQ